MLSLASFADFGLDPPASVVTFAAAKGPPATVNFGVLNPAGTSQYVRLGGAPTVYLLPRDVGDEWQVTGDCSPLARAGRAGGGAPRSSLFLPVSMAQIWAVEILVAGKLRASSAIAQATGSGTLGSTPTTTDGPVADPAMARIIAAALDSLDGDRHRDSRGAPPMRKLPPTASRSRR